MAFDKCWWLHFSIVINIGFISLPVRAVNMYRMKSEELSILSCEKGPTPKADAFYTAKNEELRGF